MWTRYGEIDFYKVIIKTRVLENFLGKKLHIKYVFTHMYYLLLIYFTICLYILNAHSTTGLHLQPYMFAYSFLISSTVPAGRLRLLLMLLSESRRSSPVTLHTV